MMLKIAVIITTYNRGEVLLKVLKEWENQTHKDFEMIVVDDGSTDGTYESLQNTNFNLNLRVLRQPQNLGAGAGRNLALENTSADVVLFVDDDAFPVPKLVERHLYWHERYDNAVVRGPVINFPDLSSLTLRPPRTFPERLRAFSRNYFCTANASIRKRYIDEVGGFNTEFKRWQDTELAYRLKTHFKLKWIYDYEATVWHYKPFNPNFDERRHYSREGRFAAKLVKLYPSNLRVRLRTGYYFPNTLLWSLLRLSPLRSIVEGTPLRRRLYYIEGFLEEMRRSDA